MIASCAFSEFLILKSILDIMSLYLLRQINIIGVSCTFRPCWMFLKFEWYYPVNVSTHVSCTNVMTILSVNINKRCDNRRCVWTRSCVWAVYVWGSVIKKYPVLVCWIYTNTLKIFFYLLWCVRYNKKQYTVLTLLTEKVPKKSWPLPNVTFSSTKVSW